MFLNTASLNLTSNSSGKQSGHCGDMMEGIAVWIAFSDFFSLVGCPACVAVLWELFEKHKRGNHATPNDVFMLNLTIMDLLFLFFTPLGLCNFLIWHFQPVQIFTNLLYGLNLAGRPILTACMCFDSYLAVVHPVTYRNHRSPTLRILIVPAVWVFTVAQGIIYTTIDEFNHSAWSMFSYLLTLPAIFICNAFILWTLKKSYCGGKKLHPMKKKALWIITDSMIMTFVAYVPPVLVYIFGPLIIKDEKIFDCYIAIPILVAPTAGSAIMPLLYLGNRRGPCK